MLTFPFSHPTSSLRCTFVFSFSSSRFLSLSAQNLVGRTILNEAQTWTWACFCTFSRFLCCSCTMSCMLHKHCFRCCYTLKPKLQSQCSTMHSTSLLHGIKNWWCINPPLGCANRAPYYLAISGDRGENLTVWSRNLRHGRQWAVDRYDLLSITKNIDTI